MDDKTKELTQAYIGKSSDYYINWAEEKGMKSYSWRWDIFLFTPLWLAYRKMWVFLSLYLSIFVITLAMTWGEEVRMTSPAYILVMLFFAVHGNSIYIAHVQNKINYNNNISNEKLRKIGGTSSIAALLTALFITVLICMVFLIRL